MATPSRHWDSCQTHRNNLNNVLVSWLFPPLGVIKINFVAAVSDTESSTAFVIRDHTGRGKQLTLTSVPQAELAAAWLGVLVVVNELQAHLIWLEGDSFTIIKWINNPSLRRGKNIPILTDIKAWLANTRSKRSNSLLHPLKRSPF